ncbi:hypothetical protein A1A1_17580, partial [Planococcus antarcticus DSM 14505]
HRRSGVLCRIAGVAYDPRIWALKLDKKKSGTGRTALTGVRRFGKAALFAAQPERLTTREELAGEAGQRKAEPTFFQ